MYLQRSKRHSFSFTQAVPEGVPVIRVMPSLPASVGCGTSAICLGTHAQSVHGDIANAIFTCCGFVETVPESYIDIVTAVCASMIVSSLLIDVGVYI